jgi:hypothetical protein
MLACDRAPTIQGNMTPPRDGSSTNVLRAVVNSPRGVVVAIVGGLSAVGGAVAGAVAALIAASVLTPTEPVTAIRVALMAVQYGFVAGLGGGVLGTAVGFGGLRRVPLGRLLFWTNVGLAAGLTTGWVGGPWAWHHMGLLGVFGFTAGAAIARVRSRGTLVLSSSLPGTRSRRTERSALEPQDTRITTLPANIDM